ncbi:MAG: glutamate-1-semialdehyde 2,1-aminomutase [Bacteriovoracia bacterium]
MTTKMDSLKLFERAKAVSPGGVHSPVRGFRGVGGHPRFIQGAKGVQITDVEGKTYTDYCLSWGPLILGHQDPDVAEAVHSAINRGWTYGAAEPYSLELAEWMTQHLPHVKKVRFVNSGTEAVMSALRVARGATGRSKILKFDGCYHGHADSMLVRAGSGLAEMASPDSAGVTEGCAKDTLVAPLNQPVALEKIFAQHGKELAAVIVEPIPANNGLLPQTPGFLKKLAELCKQNGALLIFDEVITGFRTALGGMAEVTGIVPDLVTYGKIIGGGFPVGAYAGRADLMDHVAPVGAVYQAGTLSANPVAMCAGLATLKKLKRENPYARLRSLTESLEKGINNLAARYGAELRAQSESSMFWMVAARQGDTVRAIEAIPGAQKERFAKLFHYFLDQGIYLAPSGYEVGFLATPHAPRDVDQFLATLENYLKKGA